MSLSTLQQYCARYPRIAAAANNGLGDILTYGGALATDFGNRDTSLTAGSSHSEWASGTNRIIINDASATNDVIGYSVSGRVEYNSTFTERGIVRDSVIDGTSPGSLYGIKQYNSNSVITVENCEITGAADSGIYIARGWVRNCYIHDIDGDGIRPSGTGVKLIERNLIRNIGQDTGGGHGDGLSLVETTSNLTSRFNVYCVPDDDSSYYEGVSGTQVNNSLRVNAPSGVTLSDLEFIGELCLGGATGIGCNAKTGGTVNGVSFINCWLTKAGTGTWWAEFYDFYPNAEASSTTKNILVWGARYVEDGTEVVHLPSSTGIDGLWEYEKATAPERLKYRAYRLGLLDANYDLTAHAKTGRTGWLQV